MAKEIVADILELFKDKPRISRLNEDSKTYPKLMECLTPSERNKLLKGYIDKAKINVAHIYLAQLLSQNFIDYILTVNFDNLMLRALALFNVFPPTYDMAIFNDLTTTDISEKSVVYLHGQHHGLWLLSTDEEMKKVEKIIPPILNSIKNQRLWVFIGYSGSDPIFKHITELGRFDNGLYWVTHYDNNPNDNVYKELIDKDNTNTFLIKEYDADSFMLKLNAELGLSEPFIIAKPFTSLKKSLENIVDIDDKEHFKGVKVRLEISKKEVDKAIRQFEAGEVGVYESLKNEVDINLLKKEIIDKIIKQSFVKEEITSLVEKAAKLKNLGINDLLSGLFSEWGNAISDLAKLKNDEALYKESFVKYEKAVELNPKNDSAFYNWGNAILDLAKLKNDEELYKESFVKYEKAAELNPKNDSAFNNWGNAIYALAKLKNDEELYKESFVKYEKAAELNPKNDSAFNNWGNAIYALAKLKNDAKLYDKSIEKLAKVIELGGSSYNLSCVYALKKDKSNALKFLEINLKNRFIAAEFVEKDEDWKAFEDDPEFINLIKKYKA